MDDQNPNKIAAKSQSWVDPEDIQKVYLSNKDNPDKIYAADPVHFDKVETPDHFLKRTESKTILCYTNCLVNHPWLICTLVWSIFILSTIVSLMLFAMADSDVKQLYPENNRYTDSSRARTAAQNELIDHFAISIPDYIGIRPQSQKKNFNWYLIIMAENVDGDHIFEDPTQFKTIYDFEDRFLNHAGFDDLCFTPPTADFSHESCLKFAVTSFVRTYLEYFGAAFGYTHGQPSPSSTWYPAFEANEQLGSAAPVPTVATFMAMAGSSFAALFGSYNAEYATSPFLQTFVYLAMPVPTQWVYDAETGTVVDKKTKFNSHYDRMQEQIENHMIVNMLQELWDDIVVEHNAEYVENGVNLYFHQMAVWYKSISDLIIFEASYLVSMSAWVVLLYVTYTVGSLFLAFMCSVEIMITFPIAYFFFRAVCQVTRFDGLCWGVIFVLMAVGVFYYPAFVFLDAWIQSVNIINEFDREGSRQVKYFHKRMAVAFRRSAVGILAA